MVTIRPNDPAAKPPGGRMTYAERSQLRRLRRGRDELAKALLARGVPALAVAETLR